jgi:Ion transport protein
MYIFIDVDRPAFGIIYSLMMIVIGTFFIMNLILAVIIDTFVNIQEKDKKKQLEQIVPEIVVSDSEFPTEQAVIGR